MLLTALGVTCRLIVLLVFAMSAFSKFRSGGALRAFAASTAAMTGLEHRVAKVAAPLVAGLEVAVVALLAVPIQVTSRAGDILAVLLLVAFDTTIVATIRRGVTVSCQCFGNSESPVGWKDVARNLLVMVLAVGALLSVPPAFPRLAAGDWAITVCLAIAVAALLVNFDDLTWIMRSGSPAGASTTQSIGVRRG